MVRALEESALRLVAERGPSSVSLREIAEDAGVNFGLVYQYLGTKSQVVHAVYQHSSARAAAELERADNLQDAVDALLRRGDGSAARLVAWSALEDTEVANPAYWSSPALKVLAGLARKDASSRGRDLPHEEGQVFAALMMVIATGWRLLGPAALAAADLDPIDSERHAETVRHFIRRLASEVGEEWNNQ